MLSIPFLSNGNNNSFNVSFSAFGVLAFDPSITTSVAAIVKCKPDDSPEIVIGLSTSHAFSYVPSVGNHLCRVTVVGGLGLVSTVDVGTDGIISFPFNKLVKCTSITALSNPSLICSLSDIPSKVTYCSLSYCPLVTGSISDLPPGLVYAYFLSCYLLTGSISDIPRSVLYAHFGSDSLITGSVSDLPPNIVFAYFSSCSLITGSISDMPVSLTSAYLYLVPLVTPGSLSLFIAADDFRLYSNDWLTDGVDTVINSVWVSRANYTNATPSLQIGGTNQAASGNYIAPEEGSDWHLDGATWIPLTPKAKIYDLINDVNDEDFNAWGITYT